MTKIWIHCGSRGDMLGLQMPSVLEIIQKTTEFLSGKGVEQARYNAELIIGQALGLKRMQLYLQFERLLGEAELAKIRPLVRRRGQREPLAYVLGETQFCGLRLKADRRALIPRPETEELVERCIRELKANTGAGAAPRILDLGTGSGCIALALAAAFPEARVWALDASEDALALAAENAALVGAADRVRLLKSDWFEAVAVEERFDLIVANPPYLSCEETGETPPEVREHEPAKALSSGPDGMDDLRKIVAASHRFLAPGGMLALETGITQHAELLRLMALAGYARSDSAKDLSGRERMVLGWA